MISDKVAAIGILTGLTLATVFGYSVHEAVTKEDTIATTQATLTYEEDEHGWDCYEMGNLICGDPDGHHEAEAWKSWDQLSGWRYLKVDPNRSFKVDYVGTAQMPPHLGEGEVSLPNGHGGYFVFRAQYDTP